MRWTHTHEGGDVHGPSEAVEAAVATTTASSQCRREKQATNSLIHWLYNNQSQRSHCRRRRRQDENEGEMVE